MEKYRKRIADELLDRKLQGKGAVLIEGPKWQDNDSHKTCIKCVEIG